MEEVEEVIGLRAGGVEADADGDDGVAAGDAFAALAELGVAVGGLGDGQLGGGRLEVAGAEGGVVAVTRGVDAAADAAGWGGGRLRGGGLVC